MTKYTFDAKIFAQLTVEAKSQQEAEKVLKGAMCSVNFNGVTWDASMDGEPDLLKVDGEDVE